MDEKILQELKEIKKELQDIHAILEPKEVKTLANNDYELDLGKPKLLKPKRRRLFNHSK